MYLLCGVCHRSVGMLYTTVRSRRLVLVCTVFIVTKGPADTNSQLLTACRSLELGVYSANLTSQQVSVYLQLHSESAPAVQVDYQMYIAHRTSPLTKTVIKSKHSRSSMSCLQFCIFCQSTINTLCACSRQARVDTLHSRRVRQFHATVYIVEQ